MDEFNYLTVLISIILGLGITRLLTGLGEQIEYRTQVQRYWPALCWALVLLVIHIQTWWAMFGMREHRDWTFLAFAIVLMQPSLLYLMSALVLPTPSTGEPLDLRKHYYAQSRWFFGLLATLLLVSIAKEWVLAGTLPSPLNLAFHLVFMTLSVIGAITRREWFHRFSAGVTAVLISAYIALLFSRLQ